MFPWDHYQKPLKSVVLNLWLPGAVDNSCSKLQINLKERAGERDVHKGLEML